MRCAFLTKFERILKDRYQVVDQTCQARLSLWRAPALYCLTNEDYALWRQSIGDDE